MFLRWPPSPATIRATLNVAILLPLLLSACIERERHISSSPLCEFTGITAVSEDGTVLGEDPDDWCPSPEGPPWSNGLYPARPNPSSGPVVIRFSVSHSDTAMIRVIVIGPDCTNVRTLVAGGIHPPGLHDVVWDRMDNQGLPVPPGIYRCRMTARFGRIVCEGDIQIL
jgi:hypothetical protein